MKTPKPNPWHLLLLFWAAVVLLCCGCTRTVVVPLESSHRDTLRMVMLRADTLLLRDSIHVIERTKGDTVFIETVRHRDRDRIKVIKDTLYHSRRDTVSIAVPVEKPLTRWQRTKQELGGGAMGAIVAGAVLLAVSFIRRRK